MEVLSAQMNVDTRMKAGYGSIEGALLQAKIYHLKLQVHFQILFFHNTSIN